MNEVLEVHKNQIAKGLVLFAITGLMLYDFSLLCVR